MSKDQLNDYENNDLTVQEQVKMLMEQRQANKVELGATIIEKRVNEGALIVDRDTKQPILDDEGQERHYPSKYYVSLGITGATVEVEVSKDQYDQLQITKTYHCLGTIGLVRSFGKDIVAPKIHTYVEI